MIPELARLKRLVIAEIKKNHVLEGNLGRIDLKIALLISNKDTTHTIQMKRKEAWLTKLAQSSARKREQKPPEQRYELSKERQETYGELFYMLQTEPRYLAKCLYLLQPQQVEQFLDSTIITLFGEVGRDDAARSLPVSFLPSPGVLPSRGVSDSQPVPRRHGTGDLRREERPGFSVGRLRRPQTADRIQSVRVPAPSLFPRSHARRRMQGVVYLRNTLPQVLKVVQDDAALDLELNPVMIHQVLAPGASVTEDQALENPEVKKLLEKRVGDLERVCKVRARMPRSLR